MPKVEIKNLHSKTIHCISKTEKLLDILLQETDWMHACGKKGKCTTCAVKVESDEKSLSPLSEAEIKFMSLGKLQSGHRLACQAELIDDIMISVPDSAKLPHLQYSE